MSYLSEYMNLLIDLLKIDPDSEDAERIRDLIDIPWHKLTPEEIECAGRISQYIQDLQHKIVLLKSKINFLEK